ncbi:hypothetical protein Glove_408g22 [Diversispora epigaea]|uniref:Uncharacterized protein n=1 Tax=Diversispora epigaea TaxID=1348612 RepID=A0A397GYM9_9GLOM|nr:hypothetical protein Glove_408g22 [Diversispora epigaea]
MSKGGTRNFNRQKFGNKNSDRNQKEIFNNRKENEIRNKYSKIRKKTVSKFIQNSDRNQKQIFKNQKENEIRNKYSRIVQNPKSKRNIQELVKIRKIIKQLVDIFKEPDENTENTDELDDSTETVIIDINVAIKSLENLQMFLLQQEIQKNILN